MSTHEEIIAFMANDVYNKRQRLIVAGQARIDVFDDRNAQALEAEYRAAEAEYMAAKAAFARALSADKQAA